VNLWRAVGERSVVGGIERLPFADESFETILCRYTVPQAFESEEKMDRAFGETIRILARGGKAYFFPLVTERWPEEMKEAVDRVMEKVIRIPGLEIEMEDIEINQGWGPLIRGRKLVIYKK